MFDEVRDGNFRVVGLFEPGNQVLDHTSLVSHWSKEYVSTTLVVQVPFTVVFLVLFSFLATD